MEISVDTQNRIMREHRICAGRVVATGVKRGGEWMESVRQLTLGGLTHQVDGVTTTGAATRRQRLALARATSSATSSPPANMPTCSAASSASTPIQT